MDRERRAWVRFVIIIAAAALGETIGIWQRLPSSGNGVIPTAAFAPDGSLVAIVSDTGPTCRPLLVFTD